MMQTLILTQVTKTFEATAALSDVSLSVAPGERIALLGHNGAGKSTLMKIILGLIEADRGSVEIVGHRPGSHAARAATAYLPENVAFHPALTGLEQIQLYLRLRGEPVSLALGLLERVGLGAAAKRRIGTYSKGMRQRVGLAQALIGTPQLLVLDEPTSGLDPVSRRDFYAILDELAGNGAAILLSSHALTEVEARTDRIAILAKGRLVAHDTIVALRRQAALPIQFHLQVAPQAADHVAQSLQGMRSNGSHVDLTCLHGDKIARLGQIAALGSVIEDIEIVPPSLDDIYSHFSRRDGQ
jgi:Cu-processing system ATP-binding protein